MARDLVGAYPDGVWLVELAALSEGEPGAASGGRRLGVHEQPGQPLTDTLVEALRAKRLLLVLDNCEHLVEPAAGLVDTLLSTLARSCGCWPPAGKPWGSTGEVSVDRCLLLSVPDPQGRRSSRTELLRGA